MTLRRPAKSLLLFLGLIVAVGAVVGHVGDGAAVAAFLLFVSSIQAKPSWRRFFDPPGDQDSGRNTLRFHSWRRVGPLSPQEQERLRD